MRVALVSAPYDTRAFRVGENLGIKYLAAVLDQKGIPVDVFEPTLVGLENEDLIQALLEVPYDVIGFSVMFDNALAGVSQLVQVLRAAGCGAHITTGGHVPSFIHEEILESIPGIDSVVRFEGENTLVELVERLPQPGTWGSIRGLAYRASGKTVTNPPRELVHDLDTLPFPRRDATSRHLGDPHFFVITTRGCPFTCTFCSVPAFYKEPRGPAWRARSIDNVVSELRQLGTQWDATAISFLDDEFLVGRNGKKRAAELAASIQRHRLDLAWSFECRADDVDEGLFAELQDGGLRHVFIGVESGVQRTLDTFQKRTTVDQNRQAIDTVRRLGLSLAVGFIMFDPYTTTGELRENVEFLREMRLASYKALSNKVLVYRGTPLERQLANEGRLLQDGLTRGFRFHDPAVALAHQLTTTCLAPWHELDLERRRLEFLLDNRAGDPAVAPLRGQFAHAEEAANDILSGMMREIVTFAAEPRDNRCSAAARFEFDLRRAAAREVEARLTTLRQLRHDLGTGTGGHGLRGGESHVG